MLVRLAVDEFWVGHGGADAMARSIVPAGFAPHKALQGVRLRAATANTIVLYVGRAGVTVQRGYPLPAGEELEVHVEDPSKIHVICVPAGNSQQIVTIAGDIAGETFTLTLDGHTTGPISVDAAAGTVEDALEVLPNIGAGNVSVSGDAGGPFTVEFVGALAKQDVHLLLGSDGGINEKQTVAVAGGAAGDKLVLTYNGQSTTELAYDATSAQVATALKSLNNIGDNDVQVTDGDPDGWVVEFKGALQKTDVPAITGVCGKNEKQTVVVSDALAGDKLTLTYAGQTTGEVAYDATSAEIAAALKALNNIGDSDVLVTDGDPAGWVVEFTGALAKTDVPAITGVCGKNEKQTVVVTGGAAGDKLVLTYSGQPTGELTYDATSAEVAAALKALNNIGDTDVAVTDGDPAGWVVEFTGALAKTDVPAITGVCGKNEKQTVVVTGGAAGDKLVLTYSGQPTGELTYDATSAEVAAALKALNNIGDTDVAVTDGDPAGWVVEFTGALAKTDVPAITGVCGKNEKQTVVVTGGAAGDKLVLTYDGQPTGELAYDATSAEVATALKALNNIGDTDVAVTDGDPAGWVVEFTGALAKTDVPAITGVCGKNEKQTIGLDDGVSDGTFTLTYVDQTTDPIPYNASANDVATALKALSNIGDNDVEVTGGPGPTADWVVEFKGALAHTDIATLTGDGTNLVGDTKTVTVMETVKGNAATVGVTETVKGNLATVGVTETVKGSLVTVGVTETVKGNVATVGVTETVKGNLATVNVTETQKGDAGFTVTAMKTDASAGSQFSWIAQ